MTFSGRKPPIRTSVLLVLISLILTVVTVNAEIQPTAPDSIGMLGNQSPDPSPGTALTTDAGTITTVNINATTQNPHWKAYVGNVSGELALQDASGNSVFDWNLTSMEGEIYATRKSTIVSWNNIECANITNIQEEEAQLNMTSSEEDSIVNTFNKKNHSLFYAGLTEVEENSCNSTNLYVNSQESTDFEELLLYDGNYVVYTALIEDSIIGFDGKEYDFQMILPDSGLEGNQVPETYYFYVELS